MNSSEKPKLSDSRAPYTPPRVVRISELRQGGGMGSAGIVCSPGSGATGTCSPGNAAQQHCYNGVVPCNTGSGAANCGLGQVPTISCESGNVPPTQVPQ